MSYPFDTADLLQEGVSASLATLAAIDAADLFSNLPAKPEEAELHNHGSRLLDMLLTYLHDIQGKVDQMDAARVAAAAEGR